jgi:hypothetical protein
MPTPTIDTAIRSQIDQFLTSISQLVRQAAVEAVKDALGGTDGRVAAPARRGPGRPRKVARATAAPKAAKPGKRVRRSAEDVEQVASQVLAYVQGNPGQRLEEIGRGLKVDTAGLKKPIQVLIATGRLRTEGQKRGTKYLPGSGKAALAKAKATIKKAGKRKAGKRGKKAAGRAKRKR